MDEDNEREDEEIPEDCVDKTKDEFLHQWELDLTTREAKDKFVDKVDLEKQEQVEKEVTRYIQDNFSFAIIPVEDKDKRLEIESKIISSISLCPDCRPSDNWFGLFSPKEKIRESGLWLVNELYKEKLNFSELEEIRNLAKNHI